MSHCRNFWRQKAIIGTLFLFIVISILPLTQVIANTNQQENPAPTPTTAPTNGEQDSTVQANEFVYLPLISLSIPQVEPTATYTPTPDATYTPTPNATYTVTPQPVETPTAIITNVMLIKNTPNPIVIQRSPARGEELLPDGSIELIFDRPMDQQSVEANFRLEASGDSQHTQTNAITVLQDTPAVSLTGSFEWTADNRVRFTPNNPLQREASYNVVLETGAKASDGTAIYGIYDFYFTTPGYLEVGQVIPDAGADDIDDNTAITVIFNRPVVPLVVVEEQDNLPHPLTFEPAIEGQGEWLNTSIYVFQPSEPLQKGVTYQGTVDASLHDAVGNPMQSAYTWEFTTTPPAKVKVNYVRPYDTDSEVALDQRISVDFNQDIDHNDARDAFHLRTAAGYDVAGTVGVLNETLYFTPSQLLQLDRVYNITIDAGVTSADDGLPMEEPYTSSFTTVPPPRIERTSPTDGEQAASYYTDFTIYFNAPIDPSTVVPNLEMTPPFSPTNVHTSFSSYSNAFYLDFDVQPSTAYTVTIGDGIADPYGNTIDEGRVVHFTTEPIPDRDPWVYFNTQQDIATYSSYRTTHIDLRSVNVSTVPLKLYRLQPEELIDGYIYDLPSSATLVRGWEAALEAPRNETVYSTISLTESGAPLEPGVYMLLLENQAWKSWWYNDGPDTHVLVVSDINLTLKSSERNILAWANDLHNGKPVADLAVDFYDNNGTKLGSATTDSEGVARLELHRSRNDDVIAMSQEPFAAVSSNWDSGIRAWNFDLDSTSDLPNMAAHIYTDRTLYRPDQTVYFKGVVRDEEDARFSLPSNLNTVQVRIVDPTYEEIYDEQLTLSDHGTFDGKVDIDADASLGSYTIQVSAGSTGNTFSADFQVAAYRPPEFEVTVNPQAQEIVAGKPTQVVVDVSYYFGSPVSNVPVEWTVQASDYHFAPAWAGRYSFSNTDDPWYCWDCWWMPGATPDTILSGNDTTDGKGQIIIDIPAELTYANGKPIDGSVNLTIEATATGNDYQAVSNRETMIVHASDVYVGVATQNYFGKAGEEQPIELVTTDTQGVPKPNQTLDVDVFRYTWKNTYIQDENRWTWDEVRTSVYSQTVTTDDHGQATVSFTPSEGGSYRIVASTTDSSGRKISAARFMWVAGEGYIPWRRDDNDTFTLIADKTSYTVGETSEILIPSPFQGIHYALVTVERGGILSYEVLELQGNSAVYQLPLTDEHPPNVFVSVVLFSPPTIDNSTGMSLPADYKVGILPLDIAPDPQTLNISLTAEPEITEPGEAVRYEVEVTDQDEQPVEAELSLDLVDKAVLSLMPRMSNAIVAALYGRRDLGVATASGLNISADREQKEEEEIYDENDSLDDAPQPIPTMTMLPTGTPPTMGPDIDFDTGGDFSDEDANGGEGRKDDSSAPTIREEFADTAYWDGQIQTDSEGKATVELDLPDNLTTWEMRGVGLTKDTKVGEGTTDVLATKMLLIRPVTPRFFVVGDTAELKANVSNRTDAPLETQVWLTTRSLTVTTAITQTISVPSQGEAAVTWDVVVPDVEAADVVFSAVSGQYSDASKPRLATGPDGTIAVYRYSAPEVVGTGGRLTDAGSRTEVIMLPPNIDTHDGELTVRLDPSLAASMPDSLAYLEHYEYECTEQTVSRFLPNVLTVRTLDHLGINNAELEEQLPALVEEGLSKLYSRQHSDGGWGWWSDDESRPHITAYVVFGLLQAKESGFDVRSYVLSRGLNYLEETIDYSDEYHRTLRANQQAWMLYVLSMDAQASTEHLDMVYDKRDDLSSYARAFLAMAMHNTNPDDERVDALLADLNSAALVSATGVHWEETMHDWWSMNTDTRSTAIVLSALAQLDPDNELIPNVVRWLMVARQGDAWETTQETAWSLISLTNWMSQTSDLEPNYDYGVWLDPPGFQGVSNPRASGHMQPSDVSNPVVLKMQVADLLLNEGNWLTIGRGPGTGNLYYTAHLRAFLPVEHISALDRGMSVGRRYTMADCNDGPKCPVVTEAKVGDEIRVEVSVVAPNSLYYVVVEDPLPAGAEVVDTNLATTQQNDANSSEAQVDDWLPWRWWYWWWWRWYDRSEFRDEKVVLFADHLYKGSYTYSYTMRATLPGEFRVIPTTATEFYFPEVYGRGDGQIFRITE